MLLSTEHAVLLLSVVWGGALLGVLFRVFWLGAPRWMYVPLYLLLGWAAVFYLPEFAREAPTSVFVLLIVGGGLYTIGALVYGFKKPDPWPHVVRIPRGVPHAHDRGVHRALHRRQHPRLHAATNPSG